MRAYFRRINHRVTEDTEENRREGFISSSGLLFSVLSVTLWLIIFTFRLLEDPRDHLVQRRVLHAHIDHLVAVEDRAQRLRYPAAVDAQLRHRPLAPRHLAEAFQPFRRAVGELQVEELGL